MKAYKVLRSLYCGGTWSAFDWGNHYKEPNERVLQYQYEEYTKPKEGKIYAFSSLEDAKEFHYRHSCPVNLNLLIVVGKGKKSRKQPTDLPLPPGTVFLDSFMPEEVLEHARF